jgi:hypothetical protein
MENLFGEVISSYTRAEGIADGVLIDVSETAKEAGIKFPVAVTNKLWADFIKVEGTKRSGDTEGRLWDTIWMLLVNIKRGNNGSRVDYVVRYGRKNVTLKALVHPGDNREPVITIMLPNED